MPLLRHRLSAFAAFPLVAVVLTSCATAAGGMQPSSVAAQDTSNPSRPTATGTSKEVTPSFPRVPVKAIASVGTLPTYPQTLNNCGPSSVAAVLSYWHVYRSEAQVAAVLRADNSYWGMSPIDLPAYARSLGLRALVAYGGTENEVKALISNGFPVIASQYVSSSDQIRHYRPIESYNNSTQTFVSADPYLGTGHVIAYAEFSAIWAESDYRFQVIYPPSRASRLKSVLAASGWKAGPTYRGAITWEQGQIASPAFSTPGSWIRYNGYPDIAFDRVQLSQMAKARAALTMASREGLNAVILTWVRSAITAAG